CGPEPLVTAVRTAKQFLTFAGGTPFQAAVAAVLPDRHAWLAELRSGLARRRDLLVDRLAAAGVTTYACEGTYFLQLDSRSLGYPDGERLCADLAEQAGVVAIPSVAFYDREHAGRSLVRLAFCKREELMDDAAEIGVIGGSGFYSLAENAREVALTTPYGEPSDPLTVAEIAGRRVAFLPRHGRDHRYPPHRINYRANLWALRSIGVRQIL